MFDAKAQLAALEKPTFVSESGTVTAGRPLSHPQYRKLVVDLEAAGTDEQQTEDVLREALTTMQLPVDEIIALPEPLFWKAMQDFFRCCRGEQPQNPSIPGPSSATP